MRTRAASLVATASLLLFWGVVGRVSEAGQCAIDAKATYADCKSQCKSDFDDARGLCRGVSPGCFNACLDGRSACVDAARQPLTDCLAGCDSTLSQDRQTCKGNCSCGGNSNPCNTNACFIACMNPPQLAAFTCRDACRDNFRLDTAAQLALKACANGFKTCVRSCPPASPSGAFLNE
jgi:hypothetical protein